MKKRNGIITIILMIALTVFMVFTALVGWGPTGTGAMKNIKLSVLRTEVMTPLGDAMSLVDGKERNGNLF